VNPTNAAIGYGGYELNDIANALGFDAKYVIEYTKELPVEAGFQSQEFDALPNHYENDGTEVRGYVLENVALKATGGESVEKFSDDKLEGCIIYLANPVRQFTDFTNKTTELDEVSGVYMSEEYLANSDFSEGESVKVKTQHAELVAKIVSDNKIKGEIVVIPTFDKKLNSEALVDGYRFATASIEKV
jgi:NADH-quinone oxidoreductase subunit G